jgi:glycosyltransferase involved in cell wall biosynthesis
LKGRSRKIFLIPYGVDIEKYNPTIDGSNLKRKLGIGGKKVVFALRHHEPKYGLEYLIRAIPLVLRRCENVVFIIGGDGSLRRFHEGLASELGVGGNVIFTGRIPRNEVPFYYAICDMVVVPSLQEAFGLVVSEAMASGKPVIGTSVGGIPDQIIDGYNGFLVQPKDPKAIAERIVYLVENPEEAKRMGLNGRKIVKEKFDINRKIDRIISLYNNILSRRRRENNG